MTTNPEDHTVTTFTGDDVAYEINVHSTPNERYDGVIRDLVLSTLGDRVQEGDGGTAFGDGGPLASDNYYDVSAGTWAEVVEIAGRVADATGRPVSYVGWRDGEDDPASRGRVEPAEMAPLNRCSTGSATHR